MITPIGVTINFRFSTKQYRVREALLRIREQIALLSPSEKVYFPYEILEGKLDQFTISSRNVVDTTLGTPRGATYYILVDITLKDELGLCACQWVMDDSNGVMMLRSDTVVTVYRWNLR